MLDTAPDLYPAIIRERGTRPRHGGRLEVFDADATRHNPVCGDRCSVFARRAPDGRLAEIGFEARGCAISIASADLMAECAVGLTTPDVQALAEKVATFVREAPGDVPAPLRALAGLRDYPSRHTCAMLPWDALIAALHGTGGPR